MANEKSVRLSEIGEILFLQNYIPYLYNVGFLC